MSVRYYKEEWICLDEKYFKGYLVKKTKDGFCAN